MHFNPANYQLNGFAILFKIGSSNCVSLLILTEKKLWHNSTWDFELIFHTMDINWLSPRQKFFHSSLVSRWHCNQFSQKCPKSKSDNTFTLKKPFFTSNFCKQNLSWMHCFEVMNSLLSKLLQFETISNLIPVSNWSNFES